MLVRDAQAILKPFGIIMLYDKTVKMYKVFLGSGFTYITKDQMKHYDAADFKTHVGHALVKDSIMNPTITLQ